jgi:hypothetical protein
LGLPESSEAESIQTPQGVVIFDSDADDPEFRRWGVYDTTRIFEQHIQLVPVASPRECPGQSYAIQISASASESVGIDQKFATLFGRAHFAYQAPVSTAKVINLFFTMILMRQDEPGKSLLEVGGNRQDDPDNAYSPYRKRYYIPHADDVGDETWHEGKIDFDFRDISNASYSILGVRINEGCPKPGAGKLLTRSIKVISYD